MHAATSIESRTARVAGLDLHVDAAGSGPSVIVLHRSTGPLGTAFYDELATDFTVLAPHMPGFGRSERPAAARQPRDLAVLLARWIDADLDGPVHVVGLGLGGWVAAELAAMAGSRLSTLTLVGAAGLKPTEGMIHDPLMASYEVYARLGFRDGEHYEAVYGDEPSEELLDLWDRSREMTCRLTWRPWMWSGTLPVVLRELATPSLIAWGGDDRIVPHSCADGYSELLSASRLVTFPAAGHCVELEEPVELAGHIRSLIADTNA